MELKFEWDIHAGTPRPGQFFTLRARESTDPLLRRPFAFSSFEEEQAGCIYQVRGPATRILASFAASTTIDILGPLGNGFETQSPQEDSRQSDQEVSATHTDSGSSHILVAGGIGLGPMVFLAAELGTRAPFRFIAGFRTASAIPEIRLPANSLICCDDGSTGFHGNVTEALATIHASEKVRLYACGPTPMLAALALTARVKNWEAQLSVEQIMACGVGACMGCAVPKAGGGYLRACSDGPVFHAHDIDWEAHA